jgi:hypothetical protein
VSTDQLTGVVTPADTAGLFSLPVTITGGTGQVATGNARVNNLGVITGLALTSGGAGYTNNSNYFVTYTDPIYGTINSSAVIKGIIDTPVVTVTDPGILSLTTPGSLPTGAGYSAAPSVTVTGGVFSGSSTIATATSILGNGSNSDKVVAYSITNAGRGYSTGLILRNYSGSDISGGSAYPATTSSPLSVTILGGTGVAATGLATTTGGLITGLTISTAGSGYINGQSYAISYIDPTTGLPNTTATLRAYHYFNLCPFRIIKIPLCPNSLFISRR